MKKILYILSVAAVLSACSSNDMLSPDMPPQEGNLLELDITAGDFRTNGSTPGTRAIDNGPATTFEHGDLVGVIAVQNGTVMYNNIPYRYNSSNGTWSFASGTDSKTTPCYYDPQFTYIVYYPYSNTADGVATIERLKETFVPKTDQRSKEAYRASDLLVSTSAATSRTLTAELTHAYASVSLSHEVKCTLLNNSIVFYMPTNVSDVNFTIGSDICLPFRAKDGSFRYILPNATGGTVVRWFYAFEGKTYGGSHELGSGLTANTRYVRRELIDKGSYTLDKAQTGDFYCTYTDNNEIKGLLIPGDVAYLPNGVNCIGIVFKVGKDDSDDSSYPNSMTVHGYVVALEDANSGTLAWAKRNGEFDYIIEVGTSTNTNDWKGYSNYQKIKAYTSSGWSIAYFHAANACLNFETTFPKYVAPNSSSGWFLPSAGQLKHLYENREDLSGKIDKLKSISGYEDTKWFSGERYWSSSENYDYPEYHAWYLDFGKYLDYGPKYNGNRVRGVFAF